MRILMGRVNTQFNKYVWSGRIGDVPIAGNAVLLPAIVRY